MAATQGPCISSRTEKITSKNVHALGFVDKNLFTPQLNFVFGVAQPDKDAVVALPHLKPQFYSKPEDANLYELSVLKEALHELGHVFQLGHCTNHCVMRFSNRFSQTDLKPAEFCEDCYGDLQAITQR
ncbi:MAG: hypothetical protein R6V83_06280 [Candidatus Thorarchaeota archaeon]